MPVKVGLEPLVKSSNPPGYDCENPARVRFTAAQQDVAARGADVDLPTAALLNRMVVSNAFPAVVDFWTIPPARLLNALVSPAVCHVNVGAVLEFETAPEVVLWTVPSNKRVFPCCR